MDALVSAVTGMDGELATAGQHESNELHSHLHRGQTHLPLAESVLWWVHVDILLVQDSAFQMPLPQLPRCRRQSLHQFQHNLAHWEVDTAPVKVLVALAGVDVADVDVVDADVVDADEVDVDVADEDEADADEVDVDVADAVWAQRVA